MKAAKRRAVTLPPASEAEINPAVAAIKATWAGTLPRRGAVPRWHPLLCDDFRVEPEIRQAHLPYDRRPQELAAMSREEYDGAHYDRVQTATEARNRRLFGEDHRDLIATAERNAIDAALARTTGAESVAAVRSILAPHTRESVRNGIAESEREKRARGGRKTAVKRKKEAAERYAALIVADDAILRQSPDAKVEWRAAIHHERGLGGRVAIYKKLLRRRKMP